jgi:hypothetical protein
MEDEDVIDIHVQQVNVPLTRFRIILTLARSVAVIDELFKDTFDSRMIIWVSCYPKIFYVREG